MAEKVATLVSDWNAEIQRIKWLAMANGDTGAAIELGNWADRSIQITGTFGAGGSVSLQGSNDGGTTWVTLTDQAGSALTFTSAGLRQVLQLTHMVRMTVTAGDGTTSLNAWMFMRKDV
jgi:hypothetical protein